MFCKINADKEMCASEDVLARTMGHIVIHDQIVTHNMGKPIPGYSLLL